MNPLREWRQHEGISQGAAGAIFGVTQSVWSSWERDHIADSQLGFEVEIALCSAPMRAAAVLPDCVDYRPDTVAHDIDKEAMASCVLAELGARERDIFVSYYSGQETLVELAARFKRPVNRIAQIRNHARRRIRLKLRDYMRQ